MCLCKYTRKVLPPDERSAYNIIVNPTEIVKHVCFCVSKQGDTVYATVVPELDEKLLEKTVNPIVKEYFEHGDTKEVQVM